MNNLQGNQKEQTGANDIKEADYPDILFIQCPPWDADVPPLGVAYLSSYLRKHGYRTCVFDLNIVLYNLAKDDSKYLWEQKSYNRWADRQLFQETWTKLREITSCCLKDTLGKVNTEFIGLSVNFAGIKFASELIKIIKGLNNETKIIVGGWGCVNEHMRSLFPKKLVDIFVVGEGEETLREVMEVCRGHKKTSQVQGAIFNKDRQSCYKPREAVINLDSIPWPTFSEFHLSQYRHQHILPLLGSRGCIGNCSFCNDWPLSRPYRFRSARHIFNEMRYHLENNHTDHFGFKDLLCNGNMNEFNSLCDLIIESGIKINWDSQAIPRREMVYEFLCKLKKSGCETLIYGIESFSNNVLKQMRKLFTKEVALKVLKDTHDCGIRTFINIIVGFPGETEEDFRETFDALRQNRKYITQIGAVSVCLINGGSHLEAHLRDYGIAMIRDPSIRAKKWVSIDGRNNYELRKNRAEKILALIKELGLAHVTATV